MISDALIAIWVTAVNRTGQLALLLCKAKTIGALVSLCPVKGTFDKLFSEVMLLGFCLLVLFQCYHCALRIAGSNTAVMLLVDHDACNKVHGEPTK